MRLIDADALKETLGMKDDCADCDKELRGKSKACEFDRVYTKMDFCGWIDDAPTVHPEPPKMGKWLERHVLDDKNCIEEWQTAKCSVCGKYHTTPYLYYFDLYKYCPNCGAYMGGEDAN